MKIKANLLTSTITAFFAAGITCFAQPVITGQPTNQTVHVGDTVEWVNMSTPVFHTVTFGAEPLDDAPPSQSVTLDEDRVRHAFVNSPDDSVNSGFIGVPNQEAAGAPEALLDITRFRVTFNAPGTFNYICGLHDNLGMKGTVIVRP